MKRIALTVLTILVTGLAPGTGRAAFAASGGWLVTDRGNVSVTETLFVQQGCTSTKLQGVEYNGLDGNIITLPSALTAAKNAMWEVKSAAYRQNGFVWVWVIDASCKVIDFHSLTASPSTTFSLMRGAKWVAVSGIRSVDVKWSFTCC